MKLLFTEGIGASQTTTNAQDEKIPVYETKTAAETDLVNLEVGQIIATKDEGSELSNPVDVVQDGNMHAVTSNAVYDALAEYTKKTELRHFHANTIIYSEKILIVPNISNYGNYFNGLFTWSSYGSGNYLGIYHLRFSKDSITTKETINGNSTGEFEIESDNLYFYPNGKGNVVDGGGGAYNFLLS